MNFMVLVPLSAGMPAEGSPWASRAHSSQALVSHSGPSLDFSS
jgi:hypothetical protein